MSTDLEDMDSRAIRYKLIQVKAHIYAKCSLKGCSANIKYRQSGESFLLTSCKADHKHEPYSTKSHMFSAVTEYLASIPKGVCLLKLRHTICRSFHINEKQFYYILSKLNNQIPQLDDYVAGLEK